MNRTHIVVQPTSNGLSMLSDAQPENMARNFAKSFHGSLVLPIDDPKQFTVFTNGNAELKPDIRFMNEQATYLPLGAAKAHHMPEEYYEQWERIKKAEQRAYRVARERGTDWKAWKRWERLQRKLTEHENAHNTN